MNVNELRVGNLLYNEDLKHREFVNSIQVDGVINQHISENYAGIPITEELLSKCGIAQSKTYLHGFALGGFLILKSGDLYYFNNHLLRIELKYIHEVQNLYFVLTGNDLDINL